jgi:WD40 repeat protein
MLVLSTVVWAQQPTWTQKANPLSLAINGLAFSPNGQKVISGTNCHPATIRMYDVNTANMDWNYEVPSNYLCIMGVGVSSNSDYIISIEEFGNLFIFDNSGPLPVLVDSIQTGTSYAFSNEISPDDKQVAIGCSNGKLQVYHLIGGSLLHDIQAHLNHVTSVCYSSNGDKIVSGGNDNQVKIWDTSGTLLYTCLGHTNDIRQVKVTSDNKYVISASKDKTIKIWDLQTGGLVRTINAHSNWVNGIAISPDGLRVVSASSDASCKIWNIASGNLEHTFGVADSGIINAVAWSPLGDKIATGNAKSDLSIWPVPIALNTSQLRLADKYFKIVENPAHDILKLYVPRNQDIQFLTVFNVNGNIVYRAELADSIDISRWQKGYYIAQISYQDGHTEQQQFIVR